MNNRIKYTNEKYNILIIELREEDHIQNYLELDAYILKDFEDNNKFNDLYEEDLYIIEYVNNELSISFSTSNLLCEDAKYIFMHNFKTDLSSSGSQIISNNNKIIGIQSNKLTINGRNNGIVLSFPLKEFIQFYYNKDKKELINNNINNIINNNIINDKPIDELDSKENINIKINKLNILDLSNKCIENNELSELSQSEYYNLKELDLAHNKISDIKELEKLKLQNLEKLNLNHNKLLNLNWQ